MTKNKIIKCPLLYYDAESPDSHLSNQKPQLEANFTSILYIMFSIIQHV